jgi:hypothetical protein
VIWPAQQGTTGKTSPSQKWQQQRSKQTTAVCHTHDNLRHKPGVDCDKAAIGMHLFNNLQATSVLTQRHAGKPQL